MKQHNKDLIFLGLGLFALVVVSYLIVFSTSAIEPKYSPGDIVYSGQGDRFSQVSNNLVIVTGITQDCRTDPCTPAYYRFERARLVPYPGEWNAPGGYAYADPVFSMKIREFEERYPSFIQHSDHILEHSFEVPVGVLPW